VALPLPPGTYPRAHRRVTALESCKHIPSISLLGSTYLTYLPGYLSHISQWIYHAEDDTIRLLQVRTPRSHILRCLHRLHTSLVDIKTIRIESKCRHQGTYVLPHAVLSKIVKQGRSASCRPHYLVPASASHHDEHDRPEQFPSPMFRSRWLR